MAVSGTSSTGFQAFQTAQLRLNEAADKIARNESLESQTEGIIELKQAELQAQAAAKVIQAENDVAGSILDIIV